MAMIFGDTLFEMKLKKLQKELQSYNILNLQKKCKLLWLNFDVQITSYLLRDLKVHCQEVKEYT